MPDLDQWADARKPAGDEGGTVKTPRVALLVIGDGRDKLHDATIRSFADAISAHGFQVLDPIVRVDDREHALGFCGAIQEGWRRLRISTGAEFDYVFHLEEDWRFDRPVDLAAMADLLDAYPALAQVALRRNAVAPAEIKAGGLVELWPDEYLDKTLILPNPPPEGSEMHEWLEHGLYFTTNPSLYRASLIDRAWPSGPDCEAAFGRALLDEGHRFAMWGSRRGGPWITHTGKTRTGTGY